MYHQCSVADINAKNSNGGTPVLIASEFGHLAVVQLFTKWNASLDEQMKNGYSALLFAIRNGHLPIVKHLLNAGANSG